MIAFDSSGAQLAQLGHEGQQVLLIAAGEGIADHGAGHADAQGRGQARAAFMPGFFDGDLGLPDVEGHYFRTTSLISFAPRICMK